MSISSVIKSLQDIMRKDAGVDGDAQRLGQLSWLLFLKVFDAQEEELEFEQDNYRCPIPERFLWRNWAADSEGLTGDALLDFVNNDLFDSLKNQPANIDLNPRGYVVKEAFSDAFNNVVKAVKNYKAQEVKGGLGTGGQLGVQGGSTPASTNGSGKKKK